jgi:hypothetical protein
MARLGGGQGRINGRILAVDPRFAASSGPVRYRPACTAGLMPGKFVPSARVVAFQHGLRSLHIEVEAMHAYWNSEVVQQ